MIIKLAWRHALLEPTQRPELLLFRETYLNDEKDDGVSWVVL